MYMRENSLLVFLCGSFFIRKRDGEEVGLYGFVRGIQGINKLAI